MKSLSEFKLFKPTWCPGCGNYGILSALMKTAVELDLEPHEIVIVTGIGCSGRINNYFKCYGIHGTHGRPLPIATGVRIVNPDLTVIAISGDGDAYSIGIGHFIHSLRRNLDIVYLVVNNHVFALTRGQASPTSKLGFISISTPYGTKEYPIDGVKLALASGGTFIARGFSGNVPQLVRLIKSAIEHKGFSFIDILSPCVVHNKNQDYNWYRSNIIDVDEISSYDFKDKKRAWEAVNNNEKIPVGLIYREEKPSLEELVLEGKEKIAFLDLTIKNEKYKSILREFY